MLQTITILDFGARPHAAHASVDGLFAVTAAPGGSGIDAIGVWTVTHVPTGTAILTTFSPIHARIAQRAVAALPLDWSSGCVARYRRQWRKYRLPVVGVKERLRTQGIRVQL